MIKRLLALLVVVIACASVPAAAEAQLISWTCNGAPDCEKWFTSPVTLDWDVDPTASGNCPPVTIKDDTPGSIQTCSATKSQVEERVTLRIKLDQKPPTVSVASDRPPDHAGWYTRPVTFSVSAADETSRVAGCDPLTYAGPDVADATVIATCRDNAGNIGTRGYKLSYDATPPDAGAAAVETGDRVVRLSWPAGPTASVTRTPGVDGRAGSVVYEGGGSGFTDRKVRNRRRYRYVLMLTDQAGNTATRELAARPRRALLLPARRATVFAPPLLTWTPVRKARYYNVQLFRGGRKVLSAWPKRARLQLKAKWRFRGKRYRLKPGVYKWYVWPGVGPRSERKYGDRIGRRSFTFTAGP